MEWKIIVGWVVKVSGLLSASFASILYKLGPAVIAPESTQNQIKKISGGAGYGVRVGIINIYFIICFTAIILLKHSRLFTPKYNEAARPDTARPVSPQFQVAVDAHDDVMSVLLTE